MTHAIPTRTISLALVVSLLLGTAAMLAPISGSQVIKNAACIPKIVKENGEDVVKADGCGDDEVLPSAEDISGLAKFVNSANALITPALFAMAAITPLACVVGAGAMMFGSRRGLVTIGAALGTLVFIASVKGIVE